MASIMQIFRQSNIVSVSPSVYYLRCYCHRSSIEDGQFRVFDIRYRTKKDVVESVKYIKAPSPPPREKRMPTNQDWSDVWPGARSFHPASVPLPVKQGFDRRGKLPPPGKYANAELMKLPNFLHLTPPAVKKHCETLQQFCTPWPERLSHNEEIDKHFPLQITSTEYCHSSPKIRDPKARIVTFQFKLSHLSLDKHSKDKIQRLLGLRYNDANDIVILTTDRCPLRKQNYDYNQYLLLALFYESWKVESWEEEKVEEDMEYYDWEKNASKKSYIALKSWSHKHNKFAVSESSLLASADLPDYRKAVFELMNEGETSQRLLNYKRAVLKILFY